MTSDRQSLFAFVGLLLAICYLATIAAVLAFYGKYTEAVGFGGLTTGLVGVLGALARGKSTLEPKGTPADPVAVTPVDQP